MQATRSVHLTLESITLIILIMQSFLVSSNFAFLGNTISSEEFFFHQCIQTISEAHPASYPVVTGVSFTGSKAAGA